MAHAAARGGGGAGDEADHGQVALAGGEIFPLEEFGGLDFRLATDLADHDDRFGFGVLQEQLQHVDEIHALHRVATNAHAGALAEAGGGGLRHRLIGQRAGAGDDAHRAAAMDMAGHDADLAGIRGDHTGAIRADQAGFGTAQGALHLHHIQHRNAFGDADDEGHFGVDRFEDGIGGEGGGDVDDRGIGPGGGHAFRHGVEHRQVQLGMHGAALAGGDTADIVRAVGDALGGVEGALGTGEALGHHLGVGVDQNAHLMRSSRQRRPFGRHRQDCRRG